MTDPTPICLPCHKEMRCEKNGVFVLYYNKQTEPLFIRCADLYDCRSCGHQVLKGFSDNSIEHWEPEFKNYMWLWESQPTEYQFWCSA